MRDKRQATLVHRNQAGKGVAAHDLRSHLGVFGVKLGGQVHGARSFPLNSCRGFSADVVHHTIDATHFIDDAIGNFSQ